MVALRVKNKLQSQSRTHFIIPVFSHIKKFLKVQYGFNVSSPIHIDEYTSIGKSVMLALRDNRKRADNQYNQHSDKLNDEITIVLTKEMAELSPRLSKLMKINVDFDMIFKQHLLTWIYAQKAAGIRPFTACKSFLQYYGIDESEYSLEAAYKFYQRS